MLIYGKTKESYDKWLKNIAEAFDVKGEMVPKTSRVKAVVELLKLTGKN